MILSLSLDQVVGLTTIVSLLVTALAIYLSLRSVRNQLWLQTFTEFTRRYNELVAELPAAARDPARELRYDEVEPDVQTNLKRFARGYFNLCSEEHYLRARKRIDADTWQIWCIGIDDMLHLRWLRDLWEQFDREYRGYVPFHDFFQQRVSTAAESLAHLREGSHADETRERQ
jgi:hypothetical protein